MTCEMRRWPPEVLIVEDELMARMVAADTLSDAGILIHEAADATEALQAIEDHPAICLMFTDINMPGDMDGLELAERVCRSDPSMRLIVTSGAMDIANAQLPSCGTFLPKPYSAQRLLRLITEKLAEQS